MEEEEEEEKEEEEEEDGGVEDSVLQEYDAVKQWLLAEVSKNRNSPVCWGEQPHRKLFM
jgi:hypothetical protein